VRLGAVSSHRQARDLLRSLKREEVLLAAVESPNLHLGPRSTRTIKEHIEGYLKVSGWASPVQVAEDVDLTLNLAKEKTVAQIQLGNIVRAFYDLMKMQAMHVDGRADCGVLIVPMQAAATQMGSNLAQFERVSNELRDVFFHQITIPVLVIGIE